MNQSNIDTKPFSHLQRRNVALSNENRELHEARVERDALATENASLAAQLARVMHERDELEKRTHDLGNRCMIAEGQAAVMRDALGVALMGGRQGDVAWAREVYRRTTAGDDIGVLMSNIKRMAGEIRRRKAAQDAGR